MGSSLKMPRGSLSLLHMQTVPLAMCGIAHSTRTKILTHSTRMSRIRNSSPPAFHPDVSHPEFFSADIPPGCLASGILLRQHSLPDVSHPEFCPADVPPSPNDRIYGINSCKNKRALVGAPHMWLIDWVTDWLTWLSYIIDLSCSLICMLLFLNWALTFLFDSALWFVA